MEDTRSPWDKLQDLIAEAKTNDELGAILRTGSPKEVTDVLQEMGFLMDDIGQIFEDLEYIADRNSLRFWSPLA